MDDLSDALSIYPSADKILELLEGSKNKCIKRTSLKKTPYWNTALDLLIAYELISIDGVEKQQKLSLTEKGSEHLKKGGFGVKFPPLPSDEKKKTFKQHLDDITGLLTIFGILNAVIVFTTQIKTTDNTDSFDLNATGVQFVSISMYLLSLLVLWEIIWTTLKETQDNFKFKTLYFLLCSTTIGVGLLFLNQYNELLYGIIFISIYFGLVGVIYWFLLKLLLFFITRRTARWFSKRSKNMSFILLIISMIVTSIIIKQVLLILKRWF